MLIQLFINLDNQPWINVLCLLGNCNASGYSDNIHLSQCAYPVWNVSFWDQLDILCLKSHSILCLLLWQYQLQRKTNKQESRKNIKLIYLYIIFLKLIYLKTIWIWNKAFGMNTIKYLSIMNLNEIAKINIWELQFEFS